MYIIFVLIIKLVIKETQALKIFLVYISCEIHSKPYDKFLTKTHILFSKH